MLYITTSWDDGHNLDFKTSELLKKYNLKGTFYVSKNHPHKNSNLSDSEIFALSKEQEIGGHTVNHPLLTRVAPNEAKREIEEGKKWLENIIGDKDKVKMFCYPY